MIVNITVDRVVLAGARDMRVARALRRAVASAVQRKVALALTEPPIAPASVARISRVAGAEIARRCS